MSTYNADIVGRSVAARRAMARLTQRELADKANVSLGTLRGLELDERNVSAESFFRIASALGCSMDDLLRLPQ